MTSVEKRRSGRKSGGHRKHSDGGYSDTSSGGSFLDETDREVSNLTDRAFRSLCIGDEAVYNDSDLCSSSPCFQRDRQLAFGQSGLSRDQDREELKRAAHESFSLRVQQYGQDWLHEGMFGADFHRDPQWEVYGQNTQGRISATFQRSFMETSQQEKSLREEHLSFLSNGATELSLQQRRSRSRVSSLIRAFNSEGQRDGTGMDGKLREWDDETSWDKSALMSIQRELSEFSYQQNFNNGHFPSAGPFSSRDCYSAAAVTHMNPHSTHSLSAQVNCNSNFFIHSEYSPFKVWRDHNRFPFRQGEVSGFMPRSEFPKWYETPMYKELSLETHPQGPYRFAESGINAPRNNVAPLIHPNPPRSTSTSTVLQKTLAVEKRCESELASHYPHRKRAQSLGNNRLPSQRPSTASPTTELSQRVRNTILSTEALRQKIQMMTEQNMTAGFTANQQEAICGNDHLVPFDNVAPNVLTSKSSMTPFNISQLLTPVVHAETSEVPQFAASPQPVEHPPVRAESRGATPDVRMSSYKSRATSLLFNLKDNRKRVKSTYSPTKFKGLEAQEKTKQASVQEPRDTVIDIPDYLDSDIQLPTTEEASRTNAAFHQHVNQYHSTALSRTTCQPAAAHTGHNPEHTLSSYQAAQTQGHTVHYPGFTDFIYDTSNQVVNGQTLQEGSLSFAPYNQGVIEHGHAHKTAYVATEMQINTHNNQFRHYSVSEANTEQHFNENVGRDRSQQLKDKQDYSGVSWQDRWRQDTEKLSLKADISPWKPERTALIEKDPYAQTSHRAAVIKEELNLSRDKYRGENQQRLNKELTKTELRESFRKGASHQTNPFDNSNNAKQYASFQNNSEESQANYGQQQPEASSEKNAPHTLNRNTEGGEADGNYLTNSFKRLTDQENRNQHSLYSHKDKTVLRQETAQGKQTEHLLEMQKVQESPQSREPKLQLQHQMQNNVWSQPDRAFRNQVQAAAQHIKAQHAQAGLAETQPSAQVERPTVESARLNLAERTSSEKVKAQAANADRTMCKRVEQAKAEQTDPGDKGRGRETQPARVTREAGAMQTKEDEGQQVKAELVKRETEQAREQPTEQTVRGRIEAEQQVRAEQVERRQREQTKTEKVQAEQAKQERRNEQQATAKAAEVENVKQNHLKDVRQEKNKENLTDLPQVNAAQSTTQASKRKEAEAENSKKVEQAKKEPTKEQLANAEMTKATNVQEKWTKPAAKLTTTPHIKMEPDKVERVKTELAKAKAELAKIKEKMRGEQKEKARNKKEENVKSRDVSLGANTNETQDHGGRESTTEVNQQREDTILRGADDYERLREKYGFTNVVSTNKSKASAVGSHSSHNVKETPAAALDKDETAKEDPATARTENAAMTESHYVYSESSKEFKLTSSLDNKADGDADKMTDHSVEKSEKREPAKQTDAPQQRDPGVTKPRLLERKPKSEQSTAPSKESRSTPPRSLSHKDKVQTKQEILTSRIKAHAEKEISALKEKGLAMRDGFTAKNPKQVSQRQRPASHEGSKRHGSTASSNITPVHQMEPSGVQMASAQAGSPLSPAVTAATSASRTSQEPEKANDLALEPQMEAKQTHDEGLMESRKKDQQEANPEENCGKSKQEAVFASLNLSFGQNEDSVADDNLQIMGIRVSVRERKPSLKETPADNSTLKQMKPDGEECCDSDLHESHPSLNYEACPEKSSSMEMGTAKTKDSVIQEAPPTAKKDQSDVAVNSHDMQETKEENPAQHSTKKDEIRSDTDGNNHNRRKSPDTSEHTAKVTSATISDKNDSYRAGAETVTKQNVQLSVKEDTATVMKPFGNRDTEGKSGPLLEQEDLDPPATKQLNTPPSNSLTQNENVHVSPKLQHTGTSTDEKNEVEDDVHIDSIAIRVLPALTEKHNLKMAAVSTDVVTANERKQVAATTSEEKVSTSNTEDKTEDHTPTSTEKHMQESLEDKVQSVLSAVRKQSESQKTSSQQNSIKIINVKGNTEDEKTEKVHKSVDEPPKSLERDYFQVQGLKQTNNNIDDVSGGALKTKDNDSTSRELYKEENDEPHRSKTTEKIKRTNSESDSKQSDGRTDGSMEVDRTSRLRKHRTEGQSSPTREKQRSPYSSSPRECEVKEKPKERIAIPEISAIADYARLKVIVSEDHANTIQDFAPNKKEGFFPLIQTRHSRRPVSTADSKDLFEKGNSFPNKMEVNAKVNKEPKSLVFPITEKEHQRTGMFKLGDKERQDKLPMDVKSNEKHLTEINTSPTVQTEHVAETDAQSQRAENIHQPINPSFPKKLSCATKETRNTCEGLICLSSASGTTMAEEKNTRATEREVMAIRTQEKEEKLREAERSREKDIKVTQTAEQRAALLDKTGEQEQIKENDKRKRLKQQDEERAALEEQQRRAVQAAQQEKQRRAVQVQQQRRAALEEQQRRAVQEQQRRAALEEQQRRAAQEEQQRRAALEEQQRRAALEEQQRRAAQEEQQRRAALEEQQRRAALEEQQRRAVQEQQRRAAQEEQQRRAALEEQQRRAAQEEQQRRAAQEEQQRRAAQEEQQRRAALEEQQRRTAQEEQQRRAAQEEQQRRAVQEQQRRAAQEEQQRRAALEELQRRFAQEEQQRRTAQEEQQRRAAQEEQQRRTAHEEQQRRTSHKVNAAQISDDECIKPTWVQKRAGCQTEDYGREIEKMNEIGEKSERGGRKAENERTIIQRREQKQVKQEGSSHTELKEEGTRATQDQIRGDEIRTERREEKITWEAHRGLDTGPEMMEGENRASQRVDALQYYAITSTAAEKKPRDRQQGNNPSGLESTEESGSHSRIHRPQAPASPASSLPRSNTSSPALGTKPSMFRVKDNTTRGSSMTKSVKPRFHKNLGEDFRVGSPMERGEEEQEMNRRGALTPAHLDTGLNRLGTIKEASTFNQASSSQDYSSTPLPPHRPYSRRSLALDEDDSRSVISNMSESAESFASCATDVSNVRGLHDYERPESACSFSSDVCRSLGKPPAVPPKSEKALQRAKRLTSRRMRKELSKAAADLTGVEKPPPEVSSSTEAHAAVASPHFSPPVSIAHAPTLGSSVASSHMEDQSSLHSAHGSPHAPGPVSLPAALPSAAAPVSLSVASPHAASSASHSATPKPAPVAKYHVEPSYPQSYPLTQRKVLQDLGSGQYYVVDVPVQVKTKTFFDPETGKYVQLNVRESGQSTSRPRNQQTYPQSHVHPQVKVNPQQPITQASPAGKPFLLYPGYHGYPQNCNSISSMPAQGSSVTLHQDQQPVGENHSYAYPAPEVVENSERPRYSPEKTPYMDTVSDTDKTRNRVNAPECDANSQVTGSQGCVNDNTHPRYEPCDIITMSELEDFMDASDW